MDGPENVWVRDRGVLARVALDHCRLATQEEALGSRAVRDELDRLSAELTGTHRPTRPVRRRRQCRLPRPRRARRRARKASPRPRAIRGPGWKTRSPRSSRSRG
eukprot:10337098-Lingulodinium_polyedra.AAC.1